jgi:Flp pilus assembly protein TadD
MWLKYVLILFFFKAHYYLGIAYHELGHFESAVQSFMKVLDIDPKNSNAYNRLGLAYYFIGKKTDAFNAFQKSIEFNANHPEVYTNLGTSSSLYIIFFFH